jgi:FkbM family methyltransferase
MLSIKTLIALLTWPKFSITSYNLILGIVKQGIIPNTVIDVGGNLGQFTIASNKLFNEPVIYTFEPIPQCAKKIQCYADNLKNITVFPLAIGQEIGKATLKVNSHIQASSILPLAPTHQKSFPNAKELQEIEVDVKTLDDVLSEVDLKSPVLLKIDTQGYEANVIRGALETLKRVDYVLLEVSFKEMFKGELLFPDLLKLMESHEFKFLRPVGWLTDPVSKEVLQMDALFSRKVQ